MFKAHCKVQLIIFTYCSEIESKPSFHLQMEEGTLSLSELIEVES